MYSFKRHISVIGKNGKYQRVTVKIFNISAKVLTIKPKTPLCELHEVKFLTNINPLSPEEDNSQIKTSKFHRKFMSPALFLFELLKVGKLTRGPLVLYHLPKYWRRKPSDKNNFRILKKTHAYLQTILKAPVKFQKDRLKTVVGVTGTRYLLSIRFCSIRTQKMSKLKMQKKWQNIISGFWKTHMHIFRPS